MRKNLTRTRILQNRRFLVKEHRAFRALPSLDRAALARESNTSVAGDAVQILGADSTRTPASPGSVTRAESKARAGSLESHMDSAQPLRTTTLRVLFFVFSLPTSLAALKLVLGYGSILSLC